MIYNETEARETEARAMRDALVRIFSEDARRRVLNDYILIQVYGIDFSGQRRGKVTLMPIKSFRKHTLTRLFGGFHIIAVRKDTPVTNNGYCIMGALGEEEWDNHFKSWPDVRDIEVHILNDNNGEYDFECDSSLIESVINAWDDQQIRTRDQLRELLGLTGVA